MSGIDSTIHGKNISHLMTLMNRATIIIKHFAELILLHVAVSFKSREKFIMPVSDKLAFW